MKEPSDFHDLPESSSYDLLIEEEEEETSHRRKEKRHRHHSDEDGRKSRKHKVALPPPRGLRLCLVLAELQRLTACFCLASVAQPPGTESASTPKAGTSRRAPAEGTGVLTAPPRADASGDSVLSCGSSACAWKLQCSSQTSLWDSTFSTVEQQLK